MSSLFTGLMDAPRVSQARLRPECARYYPGLKRDAWYPVLGRGGDEFGMFLDIGWPRFVWQAHFTFRDVPPP
ncbi:MAG: hypothetical protein V3T16_06660 [Gemmatimonadales bacterium]